MNEPASPLHHVFVDFENVPQFDGAAFGTKSMHFTLLLGARQAKLDAGLVEQLLAHADAVQLVRLSSSGRNALDLALAYYVGRTLCAHPGAHVHIVSKDKDFDPLIEHLQSRGIEARRHESSATLPGAAAARPSAGAKTKAKAKAEPAKPASPLERTLAHLRKNVRNRPKTKRRLLGLLRSELGNAATDEGTAALLAELEQGGWVTIGEKEAVSYRLDAPQG